MSLDHSLRVHIRMIERACTCACTWIRVSLRAFTSINANAVSCMCLRVCSRAGLIITQKRICAQKIAKLKTHFGFRNFQDVLYTYIYCTCIYVHVPVRTIRRGTKEKKTGNIRRKKRLKIIEWKLKTKGKRSQLLPQNKTCY